MLLFRALGDSLMMSVNNNSFLAELEITGISDVL